MGREQYTNPLAPSIDRLENAIDEIDAIVKNIPDDINGIFDKTKYNDISNIHETNFYGSSVNVWEDIINETGEGYFEEIVTCTGNGVSNFEIKIHVDGELKYYGSVQNEGNIGIITIDRIETDATNVKIVGVRGIDGQLGLYSASGGFYLGNEYLSTELKMVGVAIKSPMIYNSNLRVEMRRTSYHPNVEQARIAIVGGIKQLN